MKKKIGFRLWMVPVIILICMIAMSLLSIPSIPKLEDKDTINVLEQEEFAWINDIDAVPDSKTAKRVGRQIIDKMTGNNRFHPGCAGFEVNNIKNIWKIEIGYLFGNGGVVVFDQDSGKVISAYMSK